MAGRSVAIMKRSGGRFGSSVGAIKAEAITELAAFQKGCWWLEWLRKV